MSAQDLSFAELLGATAPLGEGGAGRAFFLASPVGIIYAAELDRLRAILAPAPSRSIEEERITEALSIADALHDGHVRFADGLLALYASHHPDPVMRAEASELRALLFPEGTLLVTMSYAEEAGRAESRAAAMTAEVRAKLAHYAVSTPTGVAVSLALWIDEHLQASARSLSELLTARSRLASTSGPSPSDLRTAKRQLVALYNDVLGALRRDPTLDVDGKRQAADAERAWRDAVSEATERAGRRRNDAGRIKAPGEPG